MWLLFDLMSVPLGTKCHAIESPQQFGGTGTMMPTSETRKLGIGNGESWCRCRPLELSLFSVHHPTLWASYLVLTSAVYYLTIGCVLSDLRLRVRLRCIFPLITHSATPTTQQDLVCERTTELGSTLQNIWFFIYVGPHRVPEKGFEVAY